MMKSYEIAANYSGGSYLSKTRHAIDIITVIGNLLKEDCSINKAQSITITWKKVGGSQNSIVGR